MNCWCDDLINYTCFDCEKKSIWENYSEVEQRKLTAYQRILEAGRFDVTNQSHLILQRYINNNCLDIASVNI